MSTDLERKLIARLVDPQDMAQAWDMGLRNVVFEEPINEAMFNHIVDYWQESRTETTPTRVVLSHDFPGLHIPEQVDETLPWLIHTLQNRYVENRAQQIMIDAATTLGDDPRNTLRNLFEQAYQAAELVHPRNNRTNMADYEERRMRYGSREIEGDGMTLGLPELDEHTRGLMAGELAVLGGFAKTGKSMYLVKAAVEARKAGYTPIVFTLEMSIEEMGDRVDAFFSGISYDRMSKGRLMMQELDELRAAQEQLAAMGFLHIEKPERGERTVRNLISRARTVGADFVLIDQLSFMDSPNKHRDNKTKHSEIIFDLKDEINREAAGRLPCLLACQFNRQTQAGDGRGQMENFANASEIEQTCDIALGLWRSREMRANHAMQLDIMGSRRSDTTSWVLDWELREGTNIAVKPDVEPQ